ncbi:tRNA glutamyl-Q(34) synthetase GluQRS [Deinococcus roseus]|uniref:Glutamyl-Q tRNA(Asp) synthetase n=1 Tax=Deinococcus roseus TaxID=392414 RepID=A0ABQ2CYF8_9DEIO|nr:tRNA glutamyl-Q(34) synthetase GluQRS [Deinococcus roseus]GGJ32830.1 glutamyl-Q tRNA(Asp) synthetase [Deinococcus roseus]
MAESVETHSRTNNPVVGRYAPSPTGHMHLGNARTALLAWLHARSQNGRFILRFEDLDHTRVRPYAYDSIRSDLEWLGLDWDEEFIQSERIELYDQAFKKLDTYPCSCSRKDILESASAPHGAELVYPSTCLKGGFRSDRPFSWRWKVPDVTVTLQDHLAGTLTQHLPSEVGDFVLRRNDGVYAYHLAVVVDDARMGVTEVVRGFDLFAATPRQVALQQTLGYSVPEYWHVPLMKDFQGVRLAKRNGAPSLHDLRNNNINPSAIVAELTKSLGYDAPGPISPMDLVSSPLAKLDNWYKKSVDNWL